MSYRDKPPGTWIEYARTIPDDEVAQSYVCEIQNHFLDYSIPTEDILRKLIKEIIEIYGDKNVKRSS